MSSQELVDLIIRRIEDEKPKISQQWDKPKGTTTKCFIVDNLLPQKIALQLYELFPVNSKVWNRRNSFRERKSTFAKLEKVNSIILEITSAFHDHSVLNAVGQVTRIANLEADPFLYAGGISMMGKGDFLNPHIDNSHDISRARYRRLNLLYYITPSWEQKNGGNFELWDDAVRMPVEIVSKFNRLLVMETNKYSWHSVNPVVVDNNRCCVSNYYFSKESPDCSKYYHITSFLGRPNQPFRRLWGRIDNNIRQAISVKLGVSRGKSLARDLNK